MATEQLQRTIATALDTNTVLAIEKCSSPHSMSEIYHELVMYCLAIGVGSTEIRTVVVPQQVDNNFLEQEEKLLIADPKSIPVYILQDTDPQSQINLVKLSAHENRRMRVFLTTGQSVIHQVETGRVVYHLNGMTRRA